MQHCPRLWRACRRGGGRRTDNGQNIATGFLRATLHVAGLVALTHTPSPMGFLREVLGRRQNEKPALLVVTGYPAPNAQVPTLERKPLSDIATMR